MDIFLFSFANAQNELEDKVAEDEQRAMEQARLNQLSIGFV